MTLYTAYPVEEVLKGMEEAPIPLEEMEIDGLLFQVRRYNDQFVMIERLITADPQHYLNPKYAPGQMISIKPTLR